ncbi:integrase core domain-containing protein, partial [uncultured Desulfovibrio sp.]|uniref:integrase core domain-containing protein n=1 Tax=uncultured Desulfovibrio sp. TaxID=167968 RepID=UPI00345C292E
RIESEISRRLWTAMGMCSPLAVKDKRTMPQNKIPDNIVTTLPNGKAERFTGTALKERAYAQTCTRSRQRTGYLLIWAHRYTYVWPHSALGRNPAASFLITGQTTY